MGQPEVRSFQGPKTYGSCNASGADLYPLIRDVEDIWKDHFDYFYREYGRYINYYHPDSSTVGKRLIGEHPDEFIFPMTIHPDVSGRPHVLLMHERIIEHINKHEGVRWVTMAEVRV